MSSRPPSWASPAAASHVRPRHPQTHDRPASVGLIWLYGGQAISRCGDQALLVVLLVGLYRHSTGPRLAGIVLAISVLPGVLLGPWIGSWCDCAPRRRLILGSDLLAAAILLLAAWAWTDGHAVAIITLLAVVHAAVGLLQQTAVAGVLADATSAGQTSRAFALVAMGVQAAGLVGLFLGVRVLDTVGARALLCIDAASFLVCSWCVLRLGPADPPGVRMRAPEEVSSWKHV